MEEYFQPNTAICCANQEEFTELCEALTAAGFTMCHTGNGPDPTQFAVYHEDPNLRQDSLYIAKLKDNLQYTSRYYSIHDDPDNPTVVDFCNIFQKNVEVSSIDELI